MGHAIRININPQLLQWAREESGFKVDEIAQKLKIRPERYIEWEKTGKDIPLGKLKNIAQQYKRQLAIFFLADVPPKLKIPKDFRNLSLRDRGLSREIRLALRRANKYQDLMIELKGEDYWDSRYLWVKEIEQILKSQKDILSLEVSDWLRHKLKIDLNTQEKFQTTRIAFKTWRNCVEAELGISIFQFSMEVNEIQGFCLTDKLPYTIVLNSNHSHTGRIFSIFHELAHIFKHEPGICLPDIASEARNDEYQCNQFAAKFLAPDEKVLPVSDLEELKYCANVLKVSSEVYLRRNFELKHLSKGKFFEFLEKLKKQYLDYEKDKKKKKEKSESGLKPLIKSRSTRGEMFHNLVMDASKDSSRL